MRNLTKNQFHKYIAKEYRISSFEDLSDDTRFVKGTHYPHICHTRNYYNYNIVRQKLSENNQLRILDVGFFPGTLIRILKEMFAGQVVCYGAGLKLDTAFQDFMKPFMADCDYVDFDPFYSHSGKNKNLKFESNFFDMIFACEIFEHLISPLEMIAEASRVLKPGGLFIMTTPNVSHIGAVAKLILGRSNYERLNRSPMYMQNDEWRGHIRFYDKQELKTLFSEKGLILKEHRYYTEMGWEYSNRSLLGHFSHLIRKMIWLIPIYREGHYAVFLKK